MQLPIDGRLLAEHGGDRGSAVSSLVDSAVARVYDESEDGEFLEVRYAGGDLEVLHFHDFSSGAMLASIVARAKRRAVKRQVAGLGDGVDLPDIEGAVLEEFRENEDLPSTASPEDWARIGHRHGERVVAVRPLAAARSAGRGGAEPAGSGPRR
jgi:proteasome-associated ATPase